MTTGSDATQASPRTAALEIERWPTEIPLLLLVCATAASLWLVLVISIFGLLYAAMFALVFFFAQLLFVAHIRGSAVRLGPDQFPGLASRVEALAQRAGLEKTPEAYIMQEGGSLNAFATRFFRSPMIVLFSDLVEACGDDKASLDMIIGHELGHIKAGHLRLNWLLAPGMLAPFVGAAYSRARELTCDRYGAALAADREGATRGLAILAIGPKKAREVNLRAFVSQQRDLETGWMTLACWLSTYPPLSRRVAEIDQTLDSKPSSGSRGALRAISLLLACLVAPTFFVGLVAAVVVPNLMEAFALAEARSAEATAGPAPPPQVADVALATRQVTEDAERLAPLVQRFYARNGFLGDDPALLSRLWGLEGLDDEPMPLDPFDGYAYGLTETQGGGFVIWSTGPDAVTGTGDDIEVGFELDGSILALPTEDPAAEPDN